MLQKAKDEANDIVEKAKTDVQDILDKNEAIDNETT